MPKLNIFTLFFQNFVARKPLLEADPETKYIKPLLRISTVV